MGGALFLLLLAWVLVPSVADADTVYFKNGQSIWGRQVFEEGDLVIIVRPGGNIRVPKAEVGRIDPVRNTLPPHYSPPVVGAAEAPAATPRAAGRPAAAPPATATPVSTPPGPAPAPPAGGGAPAIRGATPAEPTALPPPPPPPRQ